MRVKNWKKFQHFSDRKPVWIKLYRELLDDIEWHELDAEAAKILTMIWLVASEDGGNLPCVRKLAFRIRVSQDKLNEVLQRLGHWIEFDERGCPSGRGKGEFLQNPFFKPAHWATVVEEITLTESGKYGFDSLADKLGIRNANVSMAPSVEEEVGDMF